MWFFNSQPQNLQSNELAQHINAFHNPKINLTTPKFSVKRSDTILNRISQPPNLLLNGNKEAIDLYRKKNIDN